MTDFDLEYEYCPACDFANTPDAIRCRACGIVLVTVSEGMRRIQTTQEDAE